MTENLIPSIRNAGGYMVAALDHDNLAGADGSLSITEAAKVLLVRPKDPLDWLSHNCWIYKRPDSPNRLGYQSHTTNSDLRRVVS